MSSFLQHNPLNHAGNSMPVLLTQMLCINMVLLFSPLVKTEYVHWVCDMNSLDQTVSMTIKTTLTRGF